MHVPARPIAGALVAAIALIAVVAARSSAEAQFPPPTLIFGSIADEAGEVPPGLPVRAFIGDVECTAKVHETVRTGDGAAEITAYSVDLFASGHRPGCGQPGAVVRIQIGDRFAPQTLTMGDEPIYQLDITFGDVEPAVIPTFTPTPLRTPTPEGGTAGGTPTPPGSTTTATSQTGEDSPTPANASATATPPASGTVTPGDGPGGGGGIDDPDGASPSGDDGGGGLSGWAVAAMVLGVVALAGGGVVAFTRGWLPGLRERNTG